MAAADHLPPELIADDIKADPLGLKRYNRDTVASAQKAKQNMFGSYRIMILRSRLSPRKGNDPVGPII